MKKKIAIIGSGIAGLTLGNLLKKIHRLVLRFMNEKMVL